MGSCLLAGQLPDNVMVSSPVYDWKIHRTGSRTATIAHLTKAVPLANSEIHKAFGAIKID